MRMSSRTTFLCKFIIPGIWFVALGLAGYEAISRIVPTSEPIFVAKAIFAISFLTVGLAVSLRFLGPLKCVKFEDDTLIISNYLKSTRLHLNNVAVINDPERSSHQRIIVSLSTPGVFGDEIIFMPQLFKACSTAEFLQARLTSIENGTAALSI